MPNKKINQLDSRVLSSTDLILVGDPTTGTSFKSLVSGLGLVYVPYTGATANVNLGEYALSAGQLTLDTSPTGTATVGTTRWNDTIGSSETTLKGGNVILKNGVDLVARVVNKVTPNTTLTKAAYQAVRVSGAQGQRLAVALAQANSDLNSADTIGLVTETIPTNQEGFIITVGQLENINTTGSLQGETWADGDVLYLSPTTAGAITKVKPTGSGHIVVIGYVEYAHQNNGKIYVNVMNGWELDELHDVDIVNPLNNDALIYESSTSLWKNKTIATALGYTPVPSTRTIGTTAPLIGGGDLSANRTISIPAATTLVDGYLTATDWTTFNNKQNALGFTPVPTTRTLTINGTTFDLSANRSWTIGTVTGSGVAGQVAYWDGTGSQTGSNNLFWDAANSRLGIGTSTPTSTLDLVTGAIRASSLNAYVGGIVSIGAYGTTIARFGNQSVALDGGTTITSSIINQTTLDLILRASQTAPYFMAGTTAATGNVFRINANGNVLLNTTTDSGQRLQVQGTTLLNGNVNISGSTTAAFGVARNLINPTLVATANNDVLVGLDVNPTFTNGAFTGVRNIALRLNGTLYSTGTALEIGRNTSGAINSSVIYADNNETSIINTSGTASIRFTLASVNYGRFFGSTGNLLLQNGGTFTDAGFRLDVNGTARVTGNLTASSFIKSGGTSAQILAADGSVITAGTNITISGGTISASGGGGSMAIGGAITSATAGSVLFAGTSGVLAQDNANFFWDDTNNRLGIGTATPSYKLHVSTSDTYSTLANFTHTFNSRNFKILGDPSGVGIGDGDSFAGQSIYLATHNNSIVFNTNSTTKATLTAAGRLLLGTTTESTYLLDVNGTARYTGRITSTVTNDSAIVIDLSAYLTFGTAGTNILSGAAQNIIGGGTLGFAIRYGTGIVLGTGTQGYHYITNNNALFTAGVGGVDLAALVNSSAVLQANSTTRGFLPPRMTTTQKNAIGTPAAGLMVFDTTLAKLCVYSGTAWETITSI